MHFVQRRFGLRLPAHPGGRATDVPGGWSRCSNYARDHQGILADAGADAIVERAAGACVAAVFGGSRWVRAGRGIVDVRARELRACAGTRSANLAELAGYAATC